MNTNWADTWWRSYKWSIKTVKNKNCKICKLSFRPNHLSEVFCSYNCAKIQKAEYDKRWREKQKEKFWIVKTTIYDHECIECWKQFKSTSKRQKYCWRWCLSIVTKRERIWDKNPAYRNWMYSYWAKSRKELMKTTAWYWQHEFARVCKKIRDEQIDDKWYYYCEHCWTSESLRWENHHIVFRSEKPKHKNLHNRRNILRVCIKCHNEFHKHKSIRRKYIIERKLWELFECTFI